MGEIKELLELLGGAEKSLEKPDVQSVVIRKMIPGRKAHKQIVPGEFKSIRMENDPLFVRIMAGLKDGKA